MKTRIAWACAFVLLTLTSFSQVLKGYVRFPIEKDELTATQQLKDFMKTTPGPAIILRVPALEDPSGDSDPNAYVYDAIEKELATAGFKVQDRSLLPEGMEKSKKSDYQQNKNLTGIDIVLEVRKVANNVKYSTNTVYRKNGKEKVLPDYYSVTKFGAVIEFKLVLIKNNGDGGSFIFRHTPCPPENTDCRCIIAFKDVPDRVYSTISFCEKQSFSVFDYVDKKTLEELARNGVKRMMQEMIN